MTPKVAKIGLRIIGTLDALVCLDFLARTYHAITIRDWPGVVLLLLIAAYHGLIAYLLWFRLSPRAIAFAGIGIVFWATLLVNDIARSYLGKSTARGFIVLLVLIGLIWAYRRASRYLSRLLFPSS